MSYPRNVPDANPSRPLPSGEQQVSDLLASPQIAKVADAEQYRRLLDHTPIAIAVSKLNGSEHRITYVNRAFEALTGLTMADVEGRSWAVLDGLRQEDDPRISLGDALAHGEDFIGVFRAEGEGTPPLAVQAYVSRIDAEDGLDNYWLAALVDVTARERAQHDEIERQIREKDPLLREIQHRVKNNLQLIIGLIRLEARGARRGEPVDLDQLAGRIESLRLLYDAMAATRPGGDDVDLGHYLSQIAAAVVTTHGGERVTLELKAESCIASASVAMPAGLAVNELLTNAFKYAFAERESGTILLECLRLGADRCCLVIADDGVGLPENATWPVAGKLSALIMQTLRENAGLELDVASAPARGTRVVMRFLTKAEGGKVN